MDNFSCRWTGQFEAAKTGPYTFTAGSADDVLVLTINRLTLNKTESGTTQLVAGQKYAIQVDFVERGGAAFFSVYHAFRDEPPQPLSPSRRYPATTSPDLLPPPSRPPRPMPRSRSPGPPCRGPATT